MSSTITVPDFSGEPGDSVQPADFLKKYRRWMTSLHITEDAARITHILDYLKCNSPAEDWYNEETTDKTSWATFETAFNKRFPTIEKAKKSTVDLQRELLQLRLEVEELGKTEKYGGEEVWTHVAFAEKVLSLVKAAKIDGDTSSVWLVRDKLPDIIREKVKESHDDWTAFCKAIKEVDLGHIRDGVAKYKKEKEAKEITEAKIAQLQRAQQAASQRQPPSIPLPATAPTSPIAVLRTQMNRMALGPRQTASHNHVTNSSSGGQGNSFSPPAPITEADRAALPQSLARYPLQPSTDEGFTIYRDHLRLWKERNGEQGRVTAMTGFPLTPGTARPGSGECFRCGHVGHRRDSMQCTAPQINPKKRTF